MILAPLLPTSAVAVEVIGDLPGEEPHPQEAQYISQAVPERRQEFITARRCARRALLELGEADVAIPPGPDREPLWAEGVVGSITHCRGYRAAAVARRADLNGLGIDAEPHLALPDEVRDEVVVGVEHDHLVSLTRGHPGIHWDRLLFSAKEAIYKAWFPLNGKWLSFEDVEVQFLPCAAVFRGQIRIGDRCVDGGGTGAVLEGRFAVRDALVVTAVCVQERRRTTTAGRQSSP